MSDDKRDLEMRMRIDEEAYRYFQAQVDALKTEVLRQQEAYAAVETFKQNQAKIWAWTNGGGSGG